MSKRNKKMAREDSFKKDFEPNGKKKGNRKSYKDAKWRKDEQGPGRNDISWYTPDVQLLNDTGRWPYSRPVGTPLQRHSIINIADAEDDAVPGLCMANAYLTIGDCTNGQSAANVAANAVYTFVRHVNAGSRNYDANDLMLYIMAVDSIYSFVTWVTRLYSTVPMYAQMNKYLPEALGKLQNVDLGSIRDNMANFRAKFNSLLMKIGTLVVPDSMPIFRRHAFIFQNYYTEGPSIKDQIYFYTLRNVYKFQLDSSGAGMLKNVEIKDYWNSNNELDANGIIRILEDLITPIFNDEDFNIMSGDILKAYDGKILSLMLLQDMWVAQPINNVVFLEQFKNLKALGTEFPTASGVLDITQDANKEFLQADLSDYGIGKRVNGTWLYMSAESSDPDGYRIVYDQWSRNIILTTEVSDVTPEVNMLNTRMVCMPEIEIDASKPSGLAASDLAFGSEIVGSFQIMYYDKSWYATFYRLATVELYDPTSLVDAGRIRNICQLASSFRFHPEISFVGCDSSTTPATYQASGIPVFGIDNFTCIDYEHVKDLHGVAILGEFNVPRLAIVK